MKALIQNYINGESTEAGYITECLNRAGIEAQLWADGMSAYDKMDLFSPDVVFAHYMFLTGDIIRYLSNSQIQIVINVTGIQQHELDTILKEIKEQNVNCPFMFSNLPREAIKVKANDIKIHSIMSAADVFLTSTDYFDNFDIDLGIVSDYDATSKFSEDTADIRSWHFLSTSPDLQSSDILAPIQQMPSLYPRYKKIIVTVDGPRIPQHFFDAIIHGNEVSFKSKYNMQDEVSQKVIAKLLGEDSSKWKSSVEKKHTCINRVDKLLSLLGVKDVAKNIGKAKNDNSNTQWL